MPPPDRDQFEVGPDGRQRRVELEQQINGLFASVFSGPDGQAVLDHLRSITLNQVSGPEASDGFLRHMAGQSFLVGVILERVKRGKKL